MAEKIGRWSYRRYGSCKYCKHEDSICDCTIVNPRSRQVGLFIFTDYYYSPDFEPKE